MDIATFGLALLPVVGFLASGRRKPPKIRLTVRGWVSDNGSQVVQFVIRDRSEKRLVIGRELSPLDPDFINRGLLTKDFQLLRDGWRDHVLPKDWKAKRDARYRRMALRPPRSGVGYVNRGDGS